MLQFILNCTRSKLFQIMDLIGPDQKSKSYLNLFLNDIWNKRKNKNIFGMLDAIIDTISIHAYNCKSILNYVKCETLNLICYISKFPQDGRISEHLKNMCLDR